MLSLAHLVDLSQEGSLLRHLSFFGHELLGRRSEAVEEGVLGGLSGGPAAPRGASGARARCSCQHARNGGLLLRGMGHTRS